MKRLSWLLVPVIALLAMAPLPTLAGGEGPKSSGIPKRNDPSRQGFVTAQAFFAVFFQSGGSLIVAPAEYIGENF
ncbi:MAG: hypothetical protein ACTSW2_06985, partial [Alphaproteobacteria bacterium]